MASKAANRRLVREYLSMAAAPPPFITAKPLETNILEWHYLLQGPPDTPYADGSYWGKIVFPADYPYRPPSIRMFTPSGRFKPGSRICLSMSDFHPDTWNPTWTVPTILCGLLSFMSSSEDAAGCIAASPATRRTLAKDSHAWNKAQPRYIEIFPQYAEDLPPNLVQASYVGGSEQPSKSTPATPETSQSRLSRALERPPLGTRRAASKSTPAETVSSPEPARAVAHVGVSVTSIVFRYKWILVVLSVWLYFFLARIASRLLSSHSVAGNSP